MTSQKSYFKPRIAADSLKRSWPTAVLFVLLLFFTMPVALLISVQNVDMKYVNTADNLYIILCIVRYLSFVMALFAGVVCFRPMHNRVSAYYYHSLPIAREAHYIHMLTTGVICYSASLLINTILCQIILLGNYKLDASCSIMLWQGGLQNLLFFLLFFVIVMLAGSLCGTSVVQLIISLVILYIAPLMYVSFVLLATEYLRYFEATDYLSFELVEKLSVGIRAFTSLEDGRIALGIAENLFYLLLTLLIAFGGILIFRHRRAERANLPFIFPRFGSVVKYAVMVPVTILSGLFFGNLMTDGSFFWMVFGYICGALLTFMAVNAVTHKNARAMFDNFKGFLVYASAATIVILVFGFDLFSVNSFIPSGANLVSVTLESNTLPPITLTDESGMENLCLLGKAVQEFDRNNSEYYASNVHNYEIDGHDLRVRIERYDTIRLTFKQKFGPDIMKHYYVGTAAINAIAPQLKAIADTDGFADAYLASANDGFETLRNCYMRIDLFGDNSYYKNWNDVQIKSLDPALRKVVDDLNESRSTIGWAYFQRPNVGSISFYGRDHENYYRNHSYPVYFGDQLLNNLMAEHVDLESQFDRYLGNFVDSLYVINVENGRYIKIEGEEDYTAVLEAYAGDDISLFTKTDDIYCILAVSGVDTEALYDQGYDDVEVTYDQRIYHVLDGKLPAFVIDALN